MTLDFLPSNDYPTNSVTDGQFLYRALGSFWSQLFSDKAALKGYTLGMAEELIQSYYNLVEVVKQFSVKDIDLLHREKWKALLIKKSEFNALPVQAGDDLVFGQQPITDALYANKLFRVGFPKESSNAFSFKPSFSLKKFGALANRIISPSLILLPGVDIIFKNDALLFNKNLFTDPSVPRAKLITGEGVQATYIDASGNVLDDEFIVMWLYNAEQDNEELYNNFGVLFDLHLQTSQNYKDLLKALMNLSVEGPTITALNKALAALMDVPVVIDPVETVEDKYTLDTYNYVITDKNVYRTPAAYQWASGVVVGAQLHAGDVLTNNVKLFDTAIDPSWWMREVATDKLGFASHVFAASVSRQLFFANTTSLVTYVPAPVNRIVFPVQGDAADVQSFQDYINLPDNKAKIMSTLRLSAATASAAINPLDFVFNNLFKNNTLLVRMVFYSDAQINTFFNLLGDIRPYLAPHVYLLLYVNLQKTVDDIANLNSSVAIAAYPGVKFCADGSTSTGARPGTYPADTSYYKDYVNRMFCVSKGPLKLSHPLYADGTARYGNIITTKTNVVESVPATQIALRPEVTTFAGPSSPLSVRTSITDAVNAGTANGTGTAARFRYPRGMVIDPATGDILVADTGNHTIRRITRAGVVTTFAGSPLTTGTTDGTLLAARFNAPSYMVFDSSGNLYVTDHLNHTIRKITPAGVVSTLAGNAGNPGSDNGTGTAAKFWMPEGIAIDSFNNLYVVEQSNALRKITPAGVVTTFAGTPSPVSGSPGSGGSTVNGSATVARFNNPRTIAADAANNLYVAEFSGHCIRKVTPAGVVSTIAGIPSVVGNVNGSGAVSTFYNPMGISVDGNYLYVTEHSNAVRRIDLSTFQVRNIIDVSVDGQQDGFGIEARFSKLLSIIILNTGNPELGVLLADHYNHIIRHVTWAPALNLDTLYMSASEVVEGTTGAANRSIKCGLMRTDIPLLVTPPGETVARRPTNREIPSILLIDF